MSRNMLENEICIEFSKQIKKLDEKTLQQLKDGRMAIGLKPGVQQESGGKSQGNEKLWF